MREIEKNAPVQTKTRVEVKQIMTAVAANTIREIVRIANEEEIKRDNIVTLLKENGQFVLIYYK